MWTPELSIEDTALLGAIAVLSGIAAASAAWSRISFNHKHRRAYKLRRTARRNHRQIKGLTTKYLAVHDLDNRDAVKIWWREFFDSWFTRLPANFAWHHTRGDRDSKIVDEATTRLLRQLVEPWPHDALIIGGLFDVSWPSRRVIGRRRPRFSEELVKQLRVNPVRHPAAISGLDRLLEMMEAAGFFPLAHSHTQGSAEYVFQSEGIESEQYATHPHKLFFKPATTMPHLPFSHTVSGETADRHAGTVAPDIVAFIMLDQNPKRLGLGPRLYWLDRLLIALGTEHVSLLRQKDFQIIPDQSIDGNKHGSINAIELFGHGSDETQFMRFDYARIEPASGTSRIGPARRAIWALRTVLDKKEGDYLELVDLLAGDILLVNNWRVAVSWDEECSANQYYDQLVHVHQGDRLVLQVNFYYQHDRAKPERSDHH